MPVETCPLCLCSYARLGQHLVTMHSVKNPEERKLLLAMESGRVNARAGLCPVPACGKLSHRLDHHIRTHSEVSEGVQDEALRFCKRRVCLAKLTALRASDPAVPMVSTLDLEQHQLMEEDTSIPQDPEDLEEECDNPGCKKQKELLRTQVGDLKRQVDTLSETLRMVTRRYRILKRRSTSLGSARIGQVAQRLLSSLGPEEEECGPVEEDVKSSPEVPSDMQQPRDLPDTGEEKPDVDGAKPSTSQQPQDVDEDQPHYPDHVAVLNKIVEEYRRHREGPYPGNKLKENVGCQVYRIKKFLAVMSRGKKNLADFRFLNDTARIHSWVSSLRQAKMAVTTIQHYVLNVGCFMRFLSETPPQSCRLSSKALVGLRREMGSLRKSLKRDVAVHQTAVKEGKETYKNGESSCSNILSYTSIPTEPFDKMLLTCPLCPAKIKHLRHHLRSQHQIEDGEERKVLLRLARGRIKLRNTRCPQCGIIYENVERHFKSGHPELTGKMVKLLTKELEKKVAEDQLQTIRDSQQLDPPVLSALDVPVESPLAIPEECLQLGAG
ncbi:hypothetical protein R3I93_004652 [Phoxinus phoxinus]